MANKVIIYPKDDGGVAIVNPSSDWLQTKTIEDLVERVVPAGKPFEIVDVSEIPSDRTFRDAWTWQS